MKRLAFILALLLAVPARAGYTLVSTSSQRIDIGTVGNLGSLMNTAAGYSLSCWVSTTLATQNTIMMAQTTGAQGSSPNSQELQWGLQETWGGTDFASLANELLWDFGDRNNEGPLYHTAAGITLRNTGIHHHLLTVSGATGAAGGNNNPSVPAVWYVDGVAKSTWTKDFILGSTTMINWVNTVAIGAERKASATWFNFNDGQYYDCKAWDHALTASEANEVWMFPGRDSIYSGLIRRWPLQGQCLETQANDTCTPQNGASLNGLMELPGIRRRS